MGIEYKFTGHMYSAEVGGPLGYKVHIAPNNTGHWTLSIVSLRHAGTPNDRSYYDGSFESVEEAKEFAQGYVTFLESEK